MISRDERENYDKRITRLEKFRNIISNFQDSVWDEFNLYANHFGGNLDIDWQAGEMIYDKLEYLLDDFDKEIDFLKSERDYVPEEEEEVAS